ncbi:MAG: IS256 family transposase [Anaerolineae bacterium]
MISNSTNIEIIHELIEQLGQRGLHGLSDLLSRLFNEMMKAEREHAVQAAPYERTESRKGYANGFKDKKVQTRFGQLQLQVPQTRGVAFYPQCLEKGERSERALKLAIAEMYVQGVSTRRIAPIAEELCGFELSSTQVSRLSALLDEELEKFRNRPLGRIIYLYLDADYQKVRHDGQVRDLAVLKAIGVNEEGKREVLGISCSLSEAEVHWRKFLETLLERGLKGIEMIISDDHAGLRAALRATLPSVPWQRCTFHLAQNAQHYVPNIAMRGEIAQAVRDVYQALNQREAEERLKEAVIKYEKRAPKFSRWFEDNGPEGMTFYSRSRGHWKKVRTVNVVERLIILEVGPCSNIPSCCISNPRAFHFSIDFKKNALGGISGIAPTYVG